MKQNETIIKLRNLEKSYDGKTPVLRKIDLDIFPGQIIGYIGPNGAGKTTTVKILTGMLNDFQGEAAVLGQDIKKNPQELKKKIGYVPENAALYDQLTPMEFLDFLGRIYEMEPGEIREKAAKMLDVFALSADKHRRMTTFSKGMKQKVLIIAAMIHNPEILFLDEPLAGLDANTNIIIKEILARLAAKGKTLFYCSHIMDVVERICHRIVIIDKGTIIADGPFEQLQSRASAKGESLEKIFTQLTGSSRYKAAADDFMAALEEKSK